MGKARYSRQFQAWFSQAKITSAPDLQPRLFWVVCQRKDYRSLLCQVMIVPWSIVNGFQTSNAHLEHLEHLKILRLYLTKPKRSWDLLNRAAPFPKILFELKFRDPLKLNWHLWTFPAQFTPDQISNGSGRGIVIYAHSSHIKEESRSNVLNW